MNTFRFFIVTASVLLLSFTSFSQTKKQLEQQRKKYKSEILRINKLLFKEQKKEKNALEGLRDIKQKIDVRNKLISTINLEANILSKEIVESELKIQKLNKNLATLKADYSEMIYKSYRSKSQQSKTMFLLSSQNFYQAYKRLEYMKQYTQFRKKQGEEILVQTDFVQKIKDSLVYQKKLKDTLILSEKNQKEAIETDQNKQEQLISKIKKKEKKYKRDLQKNIREEKKVTARIDKIIKSEIERANRIAREKLNIKKPKTKKDNSFLLSPEAKVLAAKFEANKSKLPWPVKEGVIVRKFGKQPHSSFPGITIDSPGLHFVTSNNNEALSVFDGKVLNILVSSGGIKNVMIRHGNYITSYNNLENSYVKKGDNVVTGQKIGKIFTDKLSKETKLIFVIFKNTTRLNPASWILRR